MPYEDDKTDVLIIEHDIEPDTYIQHNGPISIKGNVGNNVRIDSDYGNIEIEGDVGDWAKFRSQDDVSISGNLGDNANIFTHEGFVEIGGNVGKRAQIESTGRITAKNIGEKSSLHSRFQRIAVQKVGDHSQILSTGRVVADEVGYDCGIESEKSYIRINGSVKEKSELKAWKKVTVKGYVDLHSVIIKEGQKFEP